MKVKCGQCGAVLKIEVSDILLVCPYCGSHLLISKGKTFPHTILKESFSDREAKRRAYALFSVEAGKGVIIEKVSLTFIPYVEISGEGEFLECLAPSFCEIYYLPFNLSKPAGEYRYLSDEDFEVSHVVFPERDTESIFREYGRERVKGILYVPFFLYDCRIEGNVISFSMNGYSGNFYCPFLKSKAVISSESTHLKIFSLNFLVPTLLSFPFYFIFKDSFLNYLGFLLFFYVLYLFYREEKINE